jgi:hypothetical protein
MSLSVLRRLAAVASLSLALVACGSDDGGDVATDAASAESSTPNPGVVPTADGGQIDFGSLEGSDTLLWFWAPW